MVWLLPWFSVGAGVSVKVTGLVTAGQPLFPVDVNNSETVPAVISPAEGTYVVFKLVGELIVPDPLVIDQRTPVALAMVPLKAIPLTSAQSVWLGPALTVIAEVIVKVSDLDTCLHKPLPVEVNVNTTLPLLLSVADG